MDKRDCFDELTKQLVQATLGFHEGEENFVRSEQYVLSNLLYHHCLDVNSHEVRHTLNELKLKYEVHGQSDRSLKLQILTDRFLECPSLEGKHADLKWAILSFLLYLSRSPTKIPLSLNETLQTDPDCTSRFKQNDDTFDWRTHLLEGEDSPDFNDEILSDWSDDETELLSEGVGFNSASTKALPVSQDASSKSVSDVGRNSKAIILESIQPQYWRLGYSESKLVHFTQASESGVQCLSEWVLLREVIWLLLCPMPGFVFIQKSHNKYSINPHVMVSTLSRESFSEALDTVCTVAGYLERLDAWIHSRNCLGTLGAYSMGLQLWRQETRILLTSLEETIKNQEETFTLLMLLSKLESFFECVVSVHSVHADAFSGCTNMVGEDSSYRILNALITRLESCTLTEVRTVLLRLFLHSLRHTLHLMSNWTSISLHVHYDNCHARKFIFLRQFLEPLEALGKSKVLLLTVMSSCMSSKAQIPQLEEPKPQSFEELLLSCLKETFGGSRESEKENKEFAAASHPGEREEEGHLETSRALPPVACNDIFLEQLFLAKNESYEEGGDSFDRWAREVQELEVHRSICIERILVSSLLPVIEKKQQQLDSYFMDILINEFDLPAQLKAMRDILLMEAGDLMYDFYSHLFTKVNQNEFLDEVSLTMHLRDCISRIHPSLADKFCVCLDGKSVAEVKMDKSDESKWFHTSSVSIFYKVDWPISLIFTEDVQKQYNELFQFCLTLKRATSGLERLNFRESVVLPNTTSRSSKGIVSQGTLAWRLHRVQLMRHWLLYFAHLLHDHFATSVFMPFHQNMDALVESKPLLNKLLEEHKRLLAGLQSECLIGLKGKESPVQFALNEIFSVIEDLSKIWLHGAGSTSVQQLNEIEERYVNSHRFLANFFRTLTKIRYIPHLHDLCQNLVSSCPVKCS